MAREPYKDDVGESEFAGGGQGPTASTPGVGVVPAGPGSDLVAWYWTDPNLAASAPEENNANIGDTRIDRVRPKN